MYTGATKLLNLLKLGLMRIYLLLLFILVCWGCQRVPDTLEPKLNYAVQDKYFLSLPSPFPPLSSEERALDVGKEMQVGLGFAHELDLYQAITAFKRAEFLCPPQETGLLMQIQYEVLLCYYMGKKWDEVIETFERGQLRYADSSFPAFHDLLLILYDTYKQTGKEFQAERIFELIQYSHKEEASRLELSNALILANIPALKEVANPSIESLIATYEARKKRVSTAQTLNAVLPGAGYFYLGQSQSALTAFFLNGLFITASVYFFETGNIAAGAIFTSFEAGWYFGGIYGAGLEAKTYNERLYESLATPLMNKERLFPALMLNYAF